MARSIPALCIVFATTTLLAGCLGQPTKPGFATMDCVNTVMGTSAPLPNIVLLKSSDFTERFGAEHNGYYVRGASQTAAADDGTTVHQAADATGTVYLSSERGPSMLAHELAHHARAHAGGGIDEAEAELVARRCGPKTRIAPTY
jgi:hypothetical protein